MFVASRLRPLLVLAAPLIFWLFWGITAVEAAAPKVTAVKVIRVVDGDTFYATYEKPQPWLWMI